MDALALTLGHNSSAVLIRDGEILGGYETERFTGVKSDSSMPIEPIMELNRRFKIASDVTYCISHWFPDGILPDSCKYWDLSKLTTTFPKREIKSITRDFTHHDSHMYSALAFAGTDFPRDYHVYVMDGFGTGAENISVYKSTNGYIELIDRFYGYNYSLGMFYQYATAFCGMKMHQHEYKMLAYETRINAFKDEVIESMNTSIDDFSKLTFEEIRGEGIPLRGLEPLADARCYIEGVLGNFVSLFNKPEHLKKRHHLEFPVRVLTSYFAQRHVENVVGMIHRQYNPQNLLVAGGLFYNVKLNSMLCDTTPGKFCAMPLAGDQGTGLGVYQYYFGDLKWPGHLFWGHRNLGLGIVRDPIQGVIPVTSYGMSDYISEELISNGFVNVVRGSMEFGPRALCNTSTLAIPDPFFCAQINKMNGRTNEMPFGLVVTEEQAKIKFLNTDKVHKSLEYMIMARDFKKGRTVGLLGGAHYYPLQKKHTCRPQVTKDPLMVKLLNRFGPLINTSLNVHGVPIVNGEREILYTHRKQRDSGINVKTIVEVN